MVREVDIETRGGLWGYYRQPNGWITIAIVTPMEKMNYVNEGWQHLSQYGLVELTTKYAADHPFETLFFHGGAKEMPVDQIQEMGFGLNPPVLPSCSQRLNQYHKKHSPSCWVNMKPVKFPQLAGIELPSYPCHHCAEIRATEAGRESHETVVHKKDMGDLKMAEALAGALNKREAPTSLIGMAETIAEALDRRSGSTVPVSLIDEVALLRAELAEIKLRQAGKQGRTRRTKANHTEKNAES